MRRKLGTVVLAFAVGLMFSVNSFAAPSISGGSGGGSYSGGGGGGGRSSGSRVRIIRSSKGSTTNVTQVNPPGIVPRSLDGSRKTEIVSGDAAIAGLPKEVVDKINGINEGKDLKTLFGREDLAGYTALNKTSAIVSKDSKTMTVKDMKSVNILNVPNFVEGLKKPIILFYNNATGMWEILEIGAIDAAKKEITVTIPGSGTFIIAYLK